MGLLGTWSRVALAALVAAGVALSAIAQESVEADEAIWLVLNRDGMLAAAEADWPVAEAAFRAALEALVENGDSGLPVLDRVSDDDARVAAVAGNLAVVLLQQDETAEARRLFERALAIRRSIFGARDPAIAESLNNLAELERRTGRLERARTLHEAALKLRREVLAEGHPDIAESLNNLGVLLRDLGETEAAAAHLGEAHGIRRERLGPGHPATLESTGNLAAVALQLGDLSTAAAVLVAAAEAIPIEAAAEGGLPAYILRQGVDVLLLEGDIDRAVLLCEEHVVDPPAASPDTANGGTLNGKATLADRLPPDLVLAELVAACARALGRVGGEARAMALLEKHLERLGASPDTPSPAIEAELRWGLAETVAEAGDLAEAEANLAMVVTLLDAAEDPRLATALNNLGSIRFERGRPLEASANLETALDLLEVPDVPPDAELLRDVLANYAVVLRTLDRNAEALAVESQLIDLATDPGSKESATAD